MAHINKCFQYQQRMETNIISHVNTGFQCQHRAMLQLVAQQLEQPQQREQLVEQQLQQQQLSSMKSCSRTEVDFMQKKTPEPKMRKAYGGDERAEPPQMSGYSTGPSSAGAHVQTLTLTPAIPTTRQFLEPRMEPPKNARQNVQTEGGKDQPARGAAAGNTAVAVAKRSPRTAEKNKQRQQSSLESPSSERILRYTLNVRRYLRGARESAESRILRYTARMTVFLQTERGSMKPASCRSQGRGARPISEGSSQGKEQASLRCPDAKNILKYIASMRRFLRSDFDPTSSRSRVEEQEEGLELPEPVPPSSKTAFRF